MQSYLHSRVFFWVSWSHLWSAVVNFQLRCGPMSLPLPDAVWSDHSDVVIIPTTIFWEDLAVQMWDWLHLWHHIFTLSCPNVTSPAVSLSVWRPSLTCRLIASKHHSLLYFSFILVWNHIFFLMLETGSELWFSWQVVAVKMVFYYLPTV